VTGMDAKRGTGSSFRRPLRADGCTPHHYGNHQPFVNHPAQSASGEVTEEKVHRRANGESRWTMRP
jgi:hypothetical protein